LKEKILGTSPRCLVLARKSFGSFADLQGYKYLDHPRYYPDVAPSDYHLFPELKTELKGRHFSSDMQLIAAREIWLHRQKFDFFSGLQNL
jgi:hypothetical protein